MPSLILLLLGLVAPAHSAGSRERLQSLAERSHFVAFYDGGRAGAAAPVAAPSRPPQEPLVAPIRDAQALREAKSLLDEGSLRVNPFVFHPKDGPMASAQASGLEGFVYGERESASRGGRQALVHHLGDYGSYLDTLLEGVSWTGEGRRRIRAILDGPGAPLERYGALMGFVTRYTEELRSAVAAADKAAWAKTARIYEIFPRSYNLKGRRDAGWTKKLDEKKFFADFGERDLASIRDMGFDTIWVMGIFPIGERGRGGSAGGSPYSIRDYETVHPDLGTPAEFKALVKRAHRAGLRVVIDFVVNHTSMDSKLLGEDPGFYIHRPAGEGRPPRGLFEHLGAGGKRFWINHGGYDSYGSLAFWEDTAQLDYSNPALRRRMIGVVDLWAREYGVDGFRVDMAYQVLNRYFSRNWRLEMPKREFVEELITEIKGKYPGTAFIAEGYDGWDELSRSGFDLVYSKNDMGRAGGHTGWYDAMTSRDPGRIRAAIRREAYLEWQSGGAEGVAFTGNHDEPAPRRALGPWMEGATFLTLLKPGSLLFYGSAEIGFDKPSAAEHKPIPFDVPVQVDWANPDRAARDFHRETFRLRREIHGLLGPAELRAPATEGAWVGYLLVPERPGALAGRSPAVPALDGVTGGAGLKGAAVIANPTGGEVEVHLSEPALGLEYRGRLPAFGYRLVRF